jgi:adenine-specific DNA-methyltransferase
VASSGVAAMLHNRRFWGCEVMEEYITQGKERLDQTEAGEVRYRPYDKPIYDARSSALSKIPDEWKEANNENTNL